MKDDAAESAVRDRTMSRRRFSWPRYWTDRATGPDDGFADTRWWLSDRAGGTLQLRDLLDDPCLVLLGEPGLGKSQALKDAAAEIRSAGLTSQLVDLGAYDDGASLVAVTFDARVWHEWRASDGVLFLFLDSLDEALLHVKAISKRLIVELSRLSAEQLQRLRLRISCRTADWLPELEEQLAEAFEMDTAPRCLTLAPLRANDIEEAAGAEGIDVKRFMTDIVQRNLERLAAFPLTLRMMLDIVVSEAGELPRTQAELFDSAVLRLVDEHNEARKRQLSATCLHAGRRVAVAERVAAAVLLSGRVAIDLDIAGHRGRDVSVRELAGFSEQDSDATGAASFLVEPRHIGEVLHTALFVGAGASRVTFMHRSLAEYLAARYMVRHQMDTKQVMTLLTSAEDPNGRLIPQLREVAAWTAALDKDVLGEVMQREPDVLLRAANLNLDHEQRERLISALLTEDTAMRVGRFDRRTRGALRELVHPRLPDQIRRALRPSSPPQVRRTAFTIAHDAAMPELQADLLAFALDPEQPAYIRDDAVWALTEYADAQTRAALVSLATERIDDDHDDSIKGQALIATFPSNLAVSEVLRVLTPPRDEKLLGVYKLFVLDTFPKALSKEHLVEALDWASTVPHSYDALDLLASLADEILGVAWPHLDDQRIRAAFIGAIAPRLAAHRDLIGSRLSSHDDRAFREESGRRLLLQELIDAGLSDKPDPEAVVYCKPRLARSTDYSWVISRLRDSLDKPAEQAWAALAAMLFDPERCDPDEMLVIAEQSAAFAEMTEPCRIAVPFDSQMARDRRRWAQQNRETSRADDAAPDMDRIIVEHLDAFEAGDRNAWWRLNLDLICDSSGRGHHGRELEADLTRLDGWQRADQKTRTRIIEAARIYLDSAPPDPEQWLLDSKIDRAAFSGYRALHLLAKRQPARLERLDRDTWARWMSIVVAFPRSPAVEDDRFDHVLLEIAADRAPQDLARWTIRLIDIENNRDGHLFVLSRLNGATAPALIDALATHFAGAELRPEAVGELAEYGMRADASKFLPLVANRLTTEEIERDRDAALAVGVAALRVAPSLSWPAVERAFYDDPLLGTAIFERAAHGVGGELALDLSDAALHRLLEWTLEHFPPREDPPFKDGFVTPRMSAARQRDAMVARLTERGTDDAVAAIEALARKFPSEGMNWRRLQAREARLARWTAPEPGHVIRLAQSNEAHIIQSDAHLQDALMASLRRIQNALRSGRAPELWNTGKKRTPKYEEELSTWLRSSLEQDLGAGGRLIARELQVRPNPTGRGRGESVDIAVVAPTGTHVQEARRASVTIEVKGCWNRELKTAMKSQLVEKYLTRTSTTHGIYVVFWFDREGWDASSSRRRESTDRRDELQAILTAQAERLSEETHATVLACVLDGSLHDDQPR